MLLFSLLLRNKMLSQQVRSAKFQAETANDKRVLKETRIKRGNAILVASFKYSVLANRRVKAAVFLCL